MVFRRRDPARNGPLEAPQHPPFGQGLERLSHLIVRQRGFRRQLRLSERSSLLHRDVHHVEERLLGLPGELRKLVGIERAVAHGVPPAGPVDEARVREIAQHAAHVVPVVVAKS
jgi:hypothetical protein